MANIDVKDANNITRSVPDAGQKIDSASALPAGGAGAIGWLSRLWLDLLARFPSALETNALRVWSVNGHNAVDDVVGLYASAADSVDGESALLADDTAGNVIAAQGSGVRLYVTEITVTNADADTATWVEIRSGTTVRRHVYAGTEGGGGTFRYPKPLRLGDNEALTARCLDTGASVRVAASGYRAA